MFLGVTSEPVRRYVAKVLREIRPGRVFEPCAGNFLIAQIAGLVDPAVELISGDVSPYSCTLGYALAGQDSGVRVRPEVEEQFPGLAGLSTPTDIGAAVMILADYAQNAKKAHLHYYRRLCDDFRVRHAHYLDQARAKVTAARERLPRRFSFKAEDCVESLRRVEPGDLVFFDPPYWEDGYGDMFEGLDRLMSFDAVRVSFTAMTDEAKQRVLRMLAERGATVLYRPENPVELEGFRLCFRHQYKAQKAYLVYTNAAPAVALGRSDTFPEHADRLNVVFEDTILATNTRAELIPMRSVVANHFRLLWTNKARPANMGSAFGLTLDGKLAAIISVHAGEQFGVDLALIVSDVTAPYTRYRRLSKLPLHLVLTEEFTARLSDHFLWPVAGYSTVVYSNAPVSMKYRGLFSLVKREDGSDWGFRWKLTYQQRVLRSATIAEAYAEWYAKHGENTCPSQRTALPV